MLGLALLLGFSPVQDAALDAAPPGDPAPWLARTAATQWRLGSRSSWRAFRDRWGGDWFARWDERNGTPRFLYAPGVPDAQATDLVEDVAALAGVPPTDLTLARSTKRGDRTLRQWTRTHRGAPVLGDQVMTVAVNGRIAAVWVQLTPLSDRVVPAPGESVLPLARHADPAAPSNGVVPHLVTTRADGPLLHAIDRDGAVVYTRDSRHFATVEVEHNERTVADPHVTSPARGVTVEDGVGTTAVTDAAGTHGLSGALTIRLDGPDLTISRDGARVESAGTDDATLVGGADISESAAVALHHFYVVWDWLEDRWPSHGWLGSNVPANVDISSSACNAYYTSGTINFYRGYDGYCNNFGEVADVLYHEVGHGIHHYILAGGTFAGDVSEGSADYVSATINDDPEVGPNSRWSGGYVRELATDRRYPDDAIGEVHNDGLIWGSFLWNLRADWQAALGADAGAEATDLLFLAALEQGPTLTDLYEAVIVADDDDGDLTNGTPHACDLVTLLDQHGLGPGPIGVVQFDHDPLGPQASATPGYAVAFDLANPTALCSDLDEDSITLWVSTSFEAAPRGDDAPRSEADADTGLDTADTGLLESAPSAYDDWTPIALTRSGDTWTGTIPRLPAGTRAWYFMEAASTGRGQVVRTHGGDPDRLYTFTVGDLEAVWCADFEDGGADFTHGTGWGPDQPGGSDDVDQWEVGPPAATRFSPAAATSGGNIAATDLDGDYRNLNSQYLQSPRVPVLEDGEDDPGRMLMLSYQRYLTVEDGIYDHAELRTQAGLLYANPATPGGTQHVLDTDWTLHDLDLSEHLDADGGVTLTWTLESDPGLEFGGWAMDDVCVVRLADVPGHYRRVGLDATDDADMVTITWEQPWIAPLTATALVRKRDGWPTGIDDGVIIDLDTAPVVGERKEIVDEDAMPGESFYYALFTAGEDVETWHEEVEEGVNADQGGIPEPPEPEDTSTPEDTGPEDDPADEDEDDDDAGDPGPIDPPEDKECGCASTGAGGPGWLALGLVPLALLRRRREG